MADWPWPLSAIESWLKAFRDFTHNRLHLRGEGLDTWIGRIWDLVENRLMLRDEGIDTYIGRIWDLTENRLMLEGEGIDTWIGSIYDEVMSFYGRISDTVVSTRDTILYRLTDISNEIQTGIENLDTSVDLAGIPGDVMNLLMSTINTNLVVLKEALEE